MENKFGNSFGNKSFVTALKTSSANTDNLILSANGATMYESTTNPLLDFNFSLTKYRNVDAYEIITDWDKVMKDKSIPMELKLKYIYYLSDVREGLGERRLFRIISKYMCENYPNEFKTTLKYIPEYSRWDNLLELIETPLRKEVISIVREQWIKDVKIYKENTNNV